jgi:hypothetical protein
MRVGFRSIVIFFSFFLIAVAVVAPGILYFKYYNIPEVSDSFSTASVSLFVGSCGDGTCSEEIGEDCSTCPEDCGECPAETPGGGGGSGGGGGATPKTQISFIFEPDIIQEKLVQGEFVNKNITIHNIGRQNLDVLLSISDELASLVFLENTHLLVPVWGSNSFNVLLSTSEAIDPEVYLGEIYGTVEDVQKELPVVLRIQETGAMIRIDVNIPEDNRLIYPGNIVVGEINIRNNFTSDINAKVEYSIQNRDEDIILSRLDVIKLKEGNNYFLEEFNLPEEIIPGYYLFYAKVEYEDKGYVDAASFKVEGGREEFPSFFTSRYALFGGIVFLAIVLSILFYLLFAKRRREGKKDVVNELVKSKRQVSYYSLVARTITKFNKLEISFDKKYSKEYIHEYVKLMREFFSKYYSLKTSFTFRELVNYLTKIKAANRAKIIPFIHSISEVSYTKKPMVKSEFRRVLVGTSKILRSYKSLAKAKDKYYAGKKKGKQ